MTDYALLDTLKEIEGYDSTMDMLADNIHNGRVPCICPECESTYYYEPDCMDGMCEQCKTNTVKSCFVLAGMM